MRRSDHRPVAVLVALLAIVALSGCSVFGDRNPAAGLDTGTFGTDPLTAPADTGERYGHIIESARLAEAVVLPSSVDADLLDKPPSLLPKPQHTRGTLAAVAQPILEQQGMLAGFSAFGVGRCRQQCPAPDSAKSLRITLLSMRDAGAAEAAAQQIEAADFAVNRDNARVTIPDHPAALSHWRPTVPTLGVVVARRSFVITLFVTHPTTDLDALKKSAATALAAQLDLVDHFQPTEADALATLAFDRDDLLGRMVPTERGRWPYPAVTGFGLSAAEAGDGLLFEGSGIVYGTRGAQHWLGPISGPTPDVELMAIVDGRCCCVCPTPKAPRR
ncbi:DUF7373 family lipoprotein [Nocardia sp. NPDC003963]